MRKTLSKIVAATDPGDVEAIRQLGREATTMGADAIALVGGLAVKNETRRPRGEVLKALASAGLPAYYIPGPADAPLFEFQREAANFEIVYPNLRGVHSTFTLSFGYVLVAGMGGMIMDERDSARDESETLTYPGWEVEYRLKFLHDLKDYQKIFLFTTPPMHKGHSDKGSVVLAEMIKTHKPGLVLIGASDQKNEMLGTSLVVFTGSLKDGKFTMVDLRKHHVTPCTLQAFSNVA